MTPFPQRLSAVSLDFPIRDRPSVADLPTVQLAEANLASERIGLYSEPLGSFTECNHLPTAVVVAALRPWAVLGIVMVVLAFVSNPLATGALMLVVHLALLWVLHRQNVPGSGYVVNRASA